METAHDRQIRSLNLCSFADEQRRCIASGSTKFEYLNSKQYRSTNAPNSKHIWDFELMICLEIRIFRPRRISLGLKYFVFPLLCSGGIKCQRWCDDGDNQEVGLEAAIL